MRPVSAEFLRTVTGSHEMCVRVRACEGGQTGTDPEGTELAVLSGDVTLDGVAAIQGTADVEVDGNNTWPATTSTSPIVPYGPELYVERGVQYGNGTREWVGLGYFRIQTLSQDDAPNGPIQIAGRDRMAGLIDARFIQPRQFTPGQQVGDIMEVLVQEVYPGAVIEWDSGDSDTLGRTSAVIDEDRWAFLNDIVVSRGKIWGWDYRGHLVIRDVPDPTSPVWEIRHGAGGTLVNLARDLTRDGVYNGVVARGQALDTGEAPYAAVVDASPTSPTYWGGPFGQVPRFFTSEFIVSSSQAYAAAVGMLKKLLGLPYSLDLATIPNPALEPYDAVKVAYSDSAGAQVHTITNVVIPLTATVAMSAATREQTSILLGSGV